MSLPNGKKILGAYCPKCTMTVPARELKTKEHCDVCEEANIPHRRKQKELMDERDRKTQVVLDRRTAIGFYEKGAVFVPERDAIEEFCRQRHKYHKEDKCGIN